jgi:threonine/homoserine/homoserine lactone efflux protein
METLFALVGFSFVSSVTPGPNNLLLWASGAEFGFLATGRHVIGTALGIGAMALVAAAGVAELLAVVPGLEFGLRLAASAYLIYLAYRLAGAHALKRATIARPLGLVGAAAFQVVNPKAWIFALGAVTAFRPAGLSPVVGTVAVAATMTLVVIPSAAIWAGAGGAVGGLMNNRRSGRIVSALMAVLLAVSVIAIWL